MKFVVHLLNKTILFFVTAIRFMLKFHTNITQVFIYFFLQVSITYCNSISVEIKL